MDAFKPIHPTGYRLPANLTLARRVLAFLLLVANLTPCPSYSLAAPNIVFIMADDMGIAELGITGQLARAAAGLPSIDSPNLDALATAGLRMDRFYVTPICASSRSALMTGYHNGHSSIDRNGGNNGGNAMRNVDFTMAEMLQSAGYRTAGYGKWGLGGYDHTQTGGGVGNRTTAEITHPLATPTNQGFNEFYGYLNQVHAHDYYVDFLWEQDGAGGMRVDPVDSSRYSHDLMADRTLNFISDNADASGESPFFVYGAYTIPHSRFDPPNDAIRQDYIARGYTSAQANYAAMITRLDNTVGDIVERLQDPNLDGDSSDSVYDNTLILFTSDNGGTGGENSLFGGGANLRGTKGSVHEGGIRAPLIASWNGTIAPGQIDSTHTASIDDLFATFAELSGTPAPVGMDSASFAGRFTGGAIEARASHVFEAANAGDWAIVVDDWKLSKSGSSTLGLYHLPTDPGEQTNRISSSAQIANLLRTMALDEGVESDAGSSATQTTNLVQYKSWSPSGNSADWGSASNWSGGTPVNSRGTPTNNFLTGPASNWIATVDGSGQNQDVMIRRDSTILGLSVEGSANTITTISVAPAVNLRTHNGTVIESGGRLVLDNANLHTVRTIDIRAGGTLAGSGTISTGYDTSGTPIVLSASVKNAGRLELMSGTIATGLTELAMNGDFESGQGNEFNATDAWSNYGNDQTRNARNTSNPASGAYRGIVGKANNGGPGISPYQSTAHTIGLGEEFQLDFAYAGASAWDEGNDNITATLFYESGGIDVDLFTVTVTPDLNFGDGYQSFSQRFPAISDTAAVNQPLKVRFESEGQSGEFASIDQVSLALVTSAQSLSVLTVDGDFAQSAAGEIAFQIRGNDGVPGIDFDQFVVTGQASLGGVLELGMADGVPMKPYQPVKLIDAGIVQGEFNMIRGVDVSPGRGLAVTFSNDSVYAQLALMGDANLDGIVNLDDFYRWNTNRFQSSTRWTDGDFNGDGIVDVSDFNLWNTHKFATLAQSVPEPNSVSIIAWCLFILVFRRRISGIR